MPHHQAILALAVFISLTVDGTAMAQLQPAIKWQQGPLRAKVGDVAEIEVPAGYKFADATNSRLFDESNQNIPNDGILGTLMPAEISDFLQPRWYLQFRFAADGYVKDDESKLLDASAAVKMLEVLSARTEKANEEMRRRGWSELHVIGWERPPNYDTQSHNVTWAIRATDGNHPVVNYNSRILGRGGVMSANLVLNPDQLATTVPTYNAILDGFSFNDGNRYAEFVQGDKVAQYGLIALITGGAAVVATKTGLLAKIWKPLLAIIAAGIVVLSSMWKKLFGAPKVAKCEPVAPPVVRVQESMAIARMMASPES